MTTLLKLRPDSSSSVCSAVERVHAVLDSVAQSAFEDRADVALVAEWERAIRRMESVKLRLIAAADRSSVAAASGLASTGAWLAQQVRADQAESARTVRLATALDVPTSAAATALAQGVISAEHARVVMHALDQLPAQVSALQRGEVEAALVKSACELSPARLRRRARRALETIQPDPAVVDAHENSVVLDEEERARERTRLTLHDNSDGTVTGHFTVPTLHGHLLRKVLETMTAPRRARLGATLAQTGDRSERSDWDRARGLAFCELLEHLPTDRLHGKIAATVVVTIDEDGLRDRLAVAGLDTGEVISAGEARRLACGAGLVPLVLGGASLPLDLGRSRRLFTEAQRTALATQHQSCAADGCERPFAWCEMHHRQPWAGEGPTDLANALPVCHFHHRRLHDQRYDHRISEGGSVSFHQRT